MSMNWKIIVNILGLLLGMNGLFMLLGIPFALYYGLLSIFLGIPWLIALKTCQLLYFITGNRFDPKVSEKGIYWQLYQV